MGYSYSAPIEHTTLAPVHRLPSSVTREAVRRQGSDEGFTVNPHTYEFPETGVIASEYGHEKKVAAGDLSPEHIDQYVASKTTALNQPGRHLGGWRHAGEDYLDVNRRFATQRAAIDFGRRNAQIAVFDLDKGRSFDVPFNVGTTFVGEPGTLPIDQNQKRREHNEIGRQAAVQQIKAHRGEVSPQEAGARIADAIFEQRAMNRQAAY